MDADTLFLVLRVVVALGVVLAVLWVLRRRLAKGGAKPSGTRSAGRRSTLSLFGRPSRGATAAVRGRHALGQKSSVAVVEFDGREFLLGVTEHGVTVLHEAGTDDEVVEDAVVEPVEIAAPVIEPVEATAPQVEPVEAPAAAAATPVPTSSTGDSASDAPDWAALFARELLAAQQAMTAAAPAPTPVSAAAHDPATVFAPRYARSSARVVEPDDEIDPASGLVPRPLPVRTLVTGQFVAEVELMPLPTSTIPVVPAAAIPAPDPAAAPVAVAPPPAPRPAPAHQILPTTAMIPTIVMPPRPAPTPVAAAAPERQPVAVAPRAAAGSPLAGSILSPETWRQTVDAFRQLR